MSDRDGKVSNAIAEEICDLWRIDRARIVIEFDEGSVCFTQPLHRDEKGRLHLKVCGSSAREHETLLYGVLCVRQLVRAPEFEPHSLCVC